MKRSAGTPLLLGATALILSSCAKPMSLAPVGRTTPGGAVTNHVVVMSIDGLRPDAIKAFNARTLQKLMKGGSYTLNARTIDLSKTLPSHTSMLTGEMAEQHGIMWNTDETDTHGTIEIPTVFGMARDRGFHTAAFFSKAKFNHLEVAGTLDYSQAPDGRRTWSADRTLTDVEWYLVRRRPNVLFVHIGEPDFAGHRSGWMSHPYGKAVRSADNAVARLVAASDLAFGKGNYTLIITADHGGRGRSHGSVITEDVTIPWIAFGRGVREGFELPAGIRTVDTAATMLWLLGVTPPGPLAGVPVRAAFSTAAQASADAVAVMR